MDWLRTCTDDRVARATLTHWGRVEIVVCSRVEITDELQTRSADGSGWERSKPTPQFLMAS